jgi:CBS domain-containing protein
MVKDLLTCKDEKYLFTVSPYDTVASVIQKMSDKDLGAALVMDEDEIVGLFSERDYARKLLLHGKSSLTTPIYEVMERKVIYVTPDYSLEECLALMTKKHIRYLPVMDSNGQALALLSIDDVVSAVLEGKEFIISELTQYITGSLTTNYEKKERDNVRELIFIRPKKYGGETITA